MSDDGGKRKSNKLGRGLSALLGEDDDEQVQLDRLRQSRALPVDQLTPGPFQPRRLFDTEELRELAESVREQGVIQPILVRRAPDGETYQIIAGERRWRAAQMAQLHEVPVLIREFDDQTAMEIALVENVQRRDLSPLEEAEGYRRLIDEYAHSQEDIARAVGKSRSHVANMLRLLNLPGEVRALVDDGQLTAGHARALLMAEDPAALAREVVTRKLNVRETERLVQREKSASTGAPAAGRQKDADTRILEQDLSERTGLVVAISHNANSGAGSVTLRYRDLDQLDLIVERLSAHPARHPAGYDVPVSDSDSGGTIGPGEALDRVAGAPDGVLDAELADTIEDRADPLPEPLDLDDEDGENDAAADPSDAEGGTTEAPEVPPADEAIDPAEIRWDFEDDDDDDDYPLVPKS